MQNSTVLSIVRIITGLLVAYHGLEVFDAAKMNEYATWDSIKTLPAAKAMVYAGKVAELIGGIALAIGFCSRIHYCGHVVHLFLSRQWKVLVRRPASFFTRITVIHLFFQWCR
jgi:uncharacterized membrane protein YphA (DoxX/SURF4 family)